jgi:hypothetical protein
LGDFALISIAAILTRAAENFRGKRRAARNIAAFFAFAFFSAIFMTSALTFAILYVI